MYARKGFNRFTLMIAGKRRGVKIFLRRGSADNGNMNPVGVAYVSPPFPGEDILGSRREKKLIMSLPVSGKG